MIEKKVLIIAFIYPPLGGSGVQRTLKFSKYLFNFGWQPYLVCCDDPTVFGDGLDTSLELEIPKELQVWRRAFVDPLSFRKWVHKKLGIKLREEIASQNILEITNEGKTKNGLRRVLQFLSGLLGPFEFPPVDAALYWSLVIIPGCLRLIRREKIDLIFSTSFPYSDHITGFFLKKLTGKPWVADFRDPWTQHASSRNTGWRFMVDRWVEQRVLNTADKVIGVTPSYTEGLRNLAPLRPGDDFVVIENGYDQLDFQNIDERTSLDLLKEKIAVIAHVGYVYDGSALPFLDALKELGDDGAYLCCRFVGGIAYQEKLWLFNQNLTTDLRIEPRVSHAQAIEIMQYADVLLLLVGNSLDWVGHYPGKLFEYMASGTPILLVGPKGASADLIIRTGIGCFIDADDKEGLVSILKLIIFEPQKFREVYFHPSSEITIYERQALTQKLSDLFDQLVLKR